MPVKKFPSFSIHPFQFLIDQYINTAAYRFAATTHVLISFITFLPFSLRFSIIATLLNVQFLLPFYHLIVA